MPKKISDSTHEKVRKIILCFESISRYSILLFDFKARNLIKTWQNQPVNFDFQRFFNQLGIWVRFRADEQNYGSEHPPVKMAENGKKHEIKVKTQKRPFLPRSEVAKRSQKVPNVKKVKKVGFRPKFDFFYHDSKPPSTILPMTNTTTRERAFAKRRRAITRNPSA